MGYRCRWKIVGWAQPEIKPATTTEQRQKIACFVVTKAVGFNTVFDVRSLCGRRLGQVRTTYAGQFYRLQGNTKFLWASNEWNPDIYPLHALAILLLLEDAEAAAAVPALP